MEYNTPNYCLSALRTTHSVFELHLIIMYISDFTKILYHGPPPPPPTRSPPSWLTPQGREAAPLLAEAEGLCAPKTTAPRRRHLSQSRAAAKAHYVLNDLVAHVTKKCRAMCWQGQKGGIVNSLSHNRCIRWVFSSKTIWTWKAPCVYTHQKGFHELRCRPV